MRRPIQYPLLAGLLLAMVLAPGASRAQEDVAWPPDPEAIFSAGVEVVETELVEEIDTSPVVDNEARVIRIYDGEWREFPFPNDVQEVFSVTTRSDGSLFVNLEEHSFEPNERLILDPTTGIYIQPETVCSNQIRALPGEGRWYYRRNPDTSRIHLCFTETGGFSEPLPEDVNWSYSYFGENDPDPSPDGRWLALLGYAPGDPINCVVVYSYEIATGVLNYLGCIPDVDELTYIEAWISDTQGTVLHGYPQESLSDNFYGFDVTKPNSLEFAFHGWYSYRENPPRFQYLQTDYFRRNKTGTSSSHHSPCVLYLYDADGIDWYELGYDCVSLRRVDDGYFYVRFDSNPVSTSTLVYLNRATGELTDLFTEEIETLRSISPDGRYVVLWIGNTDQVDTVDRGDFEYDLLLPDHTLRAAIFDTTTLEIVHQSEIFMGVVEWLGTNIALTAYISAENPPGIPIPDRYSLLTFEEEISENPISGQFINYSSYSPSPDNQLWLAYSDNEAVVIDPTQRIVIPVFYTPLQSDSGRTWAQYDLDIVWTDNNSLAISLHPMIDMQPDLTRAATYTIRLS